MTQVQLENLTEDEKEMLFYIVNVLFPSTSPNIEHDFNTIKWIRHEMLIKKLVEAVKSLKPEGHPTYISLMEKMGVKITIKQVETPQPSSVETTSSVQPITGSI